MANGFMFKAPFFGILFFLVYAGALFLNFLHFMLNVCKPMYP